MIKSKRGYRWSPHGIILREGRNGSNKRKQKGRGKRKSGQTETTVQKKSDN